MFLLSQYNVYLMNRISVEIIFQLSGNGCISKYSQSPSVWCSVHSGRHLITLVNTQTFCKAVFMM